MAPRRTLPVAWLCFAGVLVGLSAFYLMAAWNVFPPPLVDSAPHIIPILNYRAGHGFGAVAFGLTREYDPAGHRFLQYPPLFHMVVAALIQRPTPEAIYLCLGGLSVASLGACAWLMCQRWRDAPGRRAAWVWLASLGLCAVSTSLYTLPSAGRPESLTTLLITLAVIVFLRTGPRWQPVTAGIFIGLVAGAQIVNAIILGFVYSIYTSFPCADEAKPLPRWLREVAVAAALGVLVFFGCVSLSPHPVAETLRGIVYHITHLDNVFGFHLLYQTYFSPTSVAASSYGLFLLAWAGGFLWWTWPRLRALTVFNLGLLIAACLYFAVRASQRSYNLFPFVPMLAALAMHALARLPDDLPTVRRRALFAATAVVFALMSVGLLRDMLIYGSYKAAGVSYAESKRHFAEIAPADKPIPICLYHCLWPLATRYDHLYLYDYSPEKVLAPGPVPEPVKPWVMTHQWYMRSPTPPEIVGYRLVWDNYVRQPAFKWHGLTPGSTAPGYAFAVYQPVEP